MRDSCLLSDQRVISGRTEASRLQLRPLTHHLHRLSGGPGFQQPFCHGEPSKMEGSGELLPLAVPPKCQDRGKASGL